MGHCISRVYAKEPYRFETRKTSAKPQIRPLNLQIVPQSAYMYSHFDILPVIRESSQRLEETIRTPI